MSNRPLTANQARVLEQIWRAPIPPTTRELALLNGWYCPSKGGGSKAAEDHLFALERKGYIARQFKVARGIRVTAIPILEGTPPQITGWIKLPRGEA